MSLNKIKNLIEGLNKKEYNKILSSLKLGVELELIYSHVDNKLYIDVSNYDLLNDFYSSLDEFNDKTEEILRDYDLENNINKHPAYKYFELPSISSGADVYNGTSSEILTDFEGNTESLIDELKEQLSEIQKLRKDLENTSESHFDTQFWIKAGGFEVGDLDMVSEDVQQLSFFPEVKEYRQEVLDNLDNHILDLQNIIHDMTRYREEAIQNLEDHLGEMQIYMEVSDIMDSVSGTRTQDLLDEIEEDWGDWDIKPDGSLPVGGIEFASPVMDYESFIDKIPELCKAMGYDGFYANETCGYHIGFSSEEFDIKKAINKVYANYRSRGYNALTATMASTQQMYKSVLRHNSKWRDEHNKFATSLLSYVNGRLAKKLDEYDLRDLLYNEYFDDIVNSFKNQKYSNLNLLHSNYVELRVLGGVEGFDILKDKEKLKSFLYDAVSQAFSATKELTDKELVKLMSQIFRKPTIEK